MFHLWEVYPRLFSSVLFFITSISCVVLAGLSVHVSCIWICTDGWKMPLYHVIYHNFVKTSLFWPSYDWFVTGRISSNWFESWDIFPSCCFGAAQTITNYAPVSYLLLCPPFQQFYCVDKVPSMYRCYLFKNWNLGIWNHFVNQCRSSCTKTSIRCSGLVEESIEIVWL